MMRVADIAGAPLDVNNGLVTLTVLGPNGVLVRKQFHVSPEMAGAVKALLENPRIHERLLAGIAELEPRCVQRLYTLVLGLLRSTRGR